MVYIQSNSERTLPHHFDVACAMFGAIENAKDYRLTSFEEIESGKFDSLIKQRLFCGSVEFMREVFKRIGLNDVRLPKNSNRTSEVITLGEAKERANNGFNLFIKPVDIKLFSGLILDGITHTCLNNISDDVLVLAYDTFPSPILSEWRCYVHNNQIIDSRNYSGEFTVSPNYNYVDEIIKENRKEFPCAYTIDVGILENGDNVVIEFNDMWAIGNYGLDNITYLRLLRDRYFEIIKNIK